MLSLSSLDGGFAASGRSVSLSVVRVWPLRTDATVDPPHSVLRVEAVDASRLSTASSSTAAVGVPIELYLMGVWSRLPLVKGDVLVVSGAAALPTTGTDSLEHGFKLVLDESPASEATRVRLQGWRERVMRREGTEHTLASLREARDASAAAPAAAAASSSSAPAAASNKKQNAVGFQTASSLAAGASLAVPIDVDAAAASSSAAAGAKKRKRGSDVHGAYVYTPLAEMRRRHGEKLNCYAVVLHARPPKQTHGSDIMMSLVASDLSIPSEATTFNIFRRARVALPPDGAVQRGDIVRIHRAEVSGYQGMPIGVLPEKSSSFILIRGSLDAPIEPYFNPADTYSELDAEVIRELRLWAAGQSPHIQAPFGGNSAATASSAAASSSSASAAAAAASSVPAPRSGKYFRTLSQLDSRGFFDLVVALVHVEPSGATPGGPDLTGAFPTPIAYVWDGTDLPVTTRLQRPLLPPSFSIPVVSGGEPLITPRYGSVMPVAYHALSAHHFVGLPPADGSLCFVHLRNLVFECDREGRFFLKFQRLSHFDRLTVRDEKVVAMMTAYAARQTREMAQARMMPWSTLQSPPLTVSSATASSALPLTPLKLLMPASDAPLIGKYRVRARVIDTVPRANPSGDAAASAASSVAPSESKESEEEPGAPPSTPLAMEQICKFECVVCRRWHECVADAIGDVCLTCGSKDHLSYSYFLKIVLQDTAGCINAIVCGKEAVRHVNVDDLFQGLPAGNLYSNRTTLKFVRQRLARLVEAGSYIDIHLQSYQVYLDPPVASSQDDASQQICSQDLQAFFAPQLMPDDDDADEEAEGRAPNQPTTTVYRVMDCCFRLA